MSSRPHHASKCLSLCCSLFLTFGFQCWIVEFQQCLIVDPTLNVDFRPLFFLIWTIVKEKKNISHPLIFCNGRSLVWVELWTSNVSSRFCLHSCWMSPGQMLIRKPCSAWKITFPILYMIDVLFIRKNKVHNYFMINQTGKLWPKVTWKQLYRLFLISPNELNLNMCHLFICIVTDYLSLMQLNDDSCIWLGLHNFTKNMSH